MINSNLILRTFVTVGICLSVGACSAAKEPTLALRDVTVVDVARGSLKPSQTVLIADDRIVAVGPVDGVDVPDGVEVVEGSGDYLIPGLIDMHVHTLWHPSVPPTFLPPGVGATHFLGSAPQPKEASPTSEALQRRCPLRGPRGASRGPVRHRLEVVSPVEGSCRVLEVTFRPFSGRTGAAMPGRQQVSTSDR